MKELSKVTKYNRLKTCKKQTSELRPQKQMKDACREGNRGAKM